MHLPLKTLTFLVALGLALRLGSAPLMDADEGRNAEVGREMAASNDYVLPRMNALPYLDKPIVYFAAEAAFMEILGPTELAARLPAYLFTLATALLVFLFARRLWGEDRGWVAAIVFLALPLTIAFARIVIFDSALTFFIVAAIMAFYLAIETTERRWSALAWIAIGFGIITKGPVAILLPLLVAIPYAIKRRRFRALGSIAGLIGCVIVVAPWVWGVSQKVPDFLEYVVITETAARVATSELQRTGPPWYFLPFLIGGALPWVLVLAASWRELRRRDDATLYLWLWILIPLVFFSISQSKRPQYILPLMPPIALLVAAVWDNVRLRAAAIFVAVWGAILIVGPLLPVFRRMKPVLLGPATTTAYLLGGAFVAGGILALLMKRKELALGALALAVVSFPALSDPMLQAIGEERSARAFVTELRPRLRPGSDIIALESFTGSLVFYLGQPVTIVSRNASELTSNYILRRYDRYISDPRSTLKPLAWLEPRLRAPGEIVVITRAKDRHHRAFIESQGFRPIADSSDHVAYAR